MRGSSGVLVTVRVDSVNKHVPSEQDQTTAMGGSLTCTKTLIWIGRVVPEMLSQTDIHTDAQTQKNAGSEIGGPNEELFTSVLYDKRMNIGLSRRP